MQHTEIEQWPEGADAAQPSLAPPPAPPAAPSPAAATVPAVAPAEATATLEPTPQESAPAPVSNPVQTMIDSLGNDLHGFIASVLAHRVDGTIVASSTKFPAFSVEAITASMVQWYATSAAALQAMGGVELFGAPTAGHIDTDAATIHVRSVGDAFGLLVVTDPAAHGGVVHATLDIIDAYVGTIESLL